MEYKYNELEKLLILMGKKYPNDHDLGNQARKLIQKIKEK